jgi:uncharacterized protein (DUF433 family)
MKNSKLVDRIVVSSYICHGKPHIVGTRIMVSTILDLLSVGKTIEEITSEDYYPDLIAEDILACIQYSGQ